MKKLIKIIIIIILFSNTGCKTVYKPVYMRAEIPEPEKIPFENPVYKETRINSETIFYLDIANSKLELKKRNALDTYIFLLENAIKINNERANEDEERFEKLSGEKEQTGSEKAEGDK